MIWWFLLETGAIYCVMPCEDMRAENDTVWKSGARRIQTAGPQHTVFIHGQTKHCCIWSSWWALVLGVGGHEKIWRCPKLFRKVRYPLCECQTKWASPTQRHKITVITIPQLQISTSLLHLTTHVRQLVNRFGILNLPSTLLNSAFLTVLWATYCIIWLSPSNWLPS